MLDATDRHILSILQDNARTSNADIARKVGMAPSAILERTKKLEEKGLIREYPARLDAVKLGYGVTAFVFVSTDVRVPGIDTGKKLSAIPEVQEVHHIAGEDCYLLKVRSRDTLSLGKLLREKISNLPSVRSTRTTIVLETVKESIGISLKEGNGKSKDE